ncbi:MAG: SMI1/KNR4 family protein [Saprospiraceae bacterium]|nr:SMI1/KNR4 family protein [Saprospiraceae bacterium]
MRTITESFRLIIRKQTELNYHLLKVINKPADKDMIRRVEVELGFDFNNELKELYSCANGTNIDYETPSGLIGLIPIHVFLCLKDSVEYYKTRIDYEEFFTDWNTNTKPDKKLFPFLEDGSGNCYWVDLNKSTNNYGKIFWTNTFGENPDYVYNSLTSLFHVISECYDNGTIFLDSDGYLDCDFNNFDLIAKENNKGLKYWTGR